MLLFMFDFLESEIMEINDSIIDGVLLNNEGKLLKF